MMLSRLNSRILPSKNITKSLVVSSTNKKCSHIKPSTITRSYSSETSPENDLFELYNPNGKTTSSYKKNQIQKWRDQRNVKNQKAKDSGFKVDWNYKMSHIIERPLIVNTVEEPWRAQYDEWRERWQVPIESQKPDINQLLSDEAHEKKEEDFEDVEFKYDEPGPLITKYDKSFDKKSLRRKLGDRLFLLVKKHRDSHGWQLPQGPLPIYETFEENITPNLRDVAQSQVDKVVGPKAHLYMSGNAPFGIYSYAYPKQYQKEIDTYGADRKSVV